MPRLQNIEIVSVMTRLHHAIQTDDEKGAANAALVLVSTTVQAIHDIATAMETIALRNR